MRDERPALERDPAQFARKLRFQRVRMHVAHRMEQFRHLPLARFDDLWIGVAGGGDAKGGGQIEILLIFLSSTSQT